MNALANILGPRALFGEPLAAHTTWGMGGPADCLATARDAAEAAAVVAACRAAGCPVKALGRGSNLLAADAGYSGVMLKLAGSLAGVKARGQVIVAGGGAYLSAAVKLATRLGLTGLEWAAGIPGSVGGAIATNSGAHGADMAAAAARVTLLLPSGEVTTVAGADLPAAYRRRELPLGSLVLGVELALAPGTPESVAARVAELVAARKRSQPLGARTAGSVFRNPPGDYAGRLIEAAGLKGLAVGRAMVSPKHANFIVNQGGATAAEVLALMEAVRAAVAKRFGVELTPEVEVVGDV
jgi:UDP-N-acetylmuramate dehydrogenase